MFVFALFGRLKLEAAVHGTIGKLICLVSCRWSHCHLVAPYVISVVNGRESCGQLSRLRARIYTLSGHCTSLQGPLNQPLFSVMGKHFLTLVCIINVCRFEASHAPSITLLV